MQIFKDWATEMEQAFWDEEVMAIPVCQEIVKNWEKIKEEALSFINTKNPNTKNKKSTTLLTSKFMKIPKIKNDKITEEFVTVSDKGSWEVVYVGKNKIRSNSGEFSKLNDFYQRITLKNTGKTIEENAEYAIKFFKTYNEIVEFFAPGECSASTLSIVSPGTSISPHFGAPGFLRCHLCLVNDSGCTITIGEEQRQWHEGKLLAFKDGGPYAHSVNHTGTRDRIVLIFDISLDYARKYIKNTDF